MKLLLDTHILLWAGLTPKKLPKTARELITNPDNELFFSAASLWEITIKNGLGREDFKIDARVFRRALLDNGYTELPIRSEHAVSVDMLPQLHKDPFDRIILAQAMVEGFTLITADEVLGQYSGVRLV
jgi:PIN domain nuclease of toxin-antitoxin system